MIAATHTQPTKKPIMEECDGIAISRFVFGNKLRLSGTTAPARKVQGLSTFIITELMSLTDYVLTPGIYQPQSWNMNRCPIAPAL
jgi:hypothetical protein